MKQVEGRKKLEHVVAVETADGSYTLFDEERGIHYRSQHGAKQESEHVFLGATGLLEIEGPWRVGELGFGAAVNLTNTIRAFRSGAYGGERLEYHTVDWRPVTGEHLGFHTGEGGELARALVDAFHEGEASQEAEASMVSVESDDGLIRVVLYGMAWEGVDFGAFEADVFFHDPFSIRVNPEAWTKEVFRWERDVLKEGGRLATYSAASAVKRAMFAAGFEVATYPGPGRKREITVASQCRESLEELGRGAEVLARSRYFPQESAGDEESS